MVYAKFTPALTNVTSSKVTQWDYGQTLRIEGLKLPTAVRIDFGISGSQTTISRIGITKDGVTDAVIPDSLLEQSKNLVAYVYVNDTKEGKTVRTINIPVDARAKPEEYDSPESKELFAEAIELINDVAVRAEDAEIEAKAHADSAKESLESTHRIAIAFNETATNAVKAVNDAGSSQIQAVNNTKSEALKAVQDEGVSQLEQIQEAGENIVEASAIAEQNAKNVLANAIKGHLKGTVVVADDVSPVEHTVKVKVSGNNKLEYPFTSTSQTKNGVTFTDNGNGTLTINGTATSTTYFDLRQNAEGERVELKKGIYTFSIFGTSTDGIKVGLGAIKKDGTTLFAYTDISNGKTFEITETAEVYIYLYISNGITINSAEVYFMLGLEGAEYEPYIDPSTVNVIAGGVTYIPDSDGTVEGISSAVLADGISTNNANMIVECEYNKDTNKVIQKLADALGVTI